jgi:hypothetical protein
MASVSPHRSSAVGGVSLRIRRKRVAVDLDKLERAMTILGTRSASEAIDRALDMVIQCDEPLAGIERIIGTGGVENFFD